MCTGEAPLGGGSSSVQGASQGILLPKSMLFLRPKKIMNSPWVGKSAAASGAFGALDTGAISLSLVRLCMVLCET